MRIHEATGVWFWFIVRLLLVRYWLCSGRSMDRLAHARWKVAFDWQYVMRFPSFPIGQALVSMPDFCLWVIGAWCGKMKTFGSFGDEDSASFGLLFWLVPRDEWFSNFRSWAVQLPVASACLPKSSFSVNGRPMACIAGPASGPASSPSFSTVPAARAIFQLSSIMAPLVALVSASSL